MSFKGSGPLRTKIVINNKITEQVIQFTYLGINLRKVKMII
jgi:hypothetical protein